MELEYEKTYHQLERDHWWFKSRRNALLKMVSDFPRDSRILDIGSSSGLLLEDLREKGFEVNNLYGVDISQKAIENCHRNGFKNTRVMDAHNITLEKRSFDIIIASDCLEHLERDEEALANWFTLLKPGGRLIVFVPAFQFLWSRHDEVNFHYRRYTSHELRSKLKRNNFKVLKSGYWNFLLFLPIAGMRLLGNAFTSGNRSNGGAVDKNGDLAMPGRFVNSVLKALVNAENMLFQNLRFPFGVSTFCVAGKENELNEKTSADMG